MKKTSKKPLVSVIMPVYNAGKFVDKAITSILRQTYNNLEIIVVDDGSTDDSLKILNKYAKADKRVKIIALDKNCGPSYASNLAIKKASGVYLARMDADDISLPRRLDKQVKFLQEHPEVAILGGQCKLIDKKGKLIGKKTFPVRNNEIVKSLFSRNPIQHPACMINLRKLSKNAMLHDGKSVLAHDLETVFLASRYGNLANLKDFVLKYRQYPESFSLTNPKKTFIATLKVRLQAVVKYAYRPTIKGILATVAQAIFVAVVPKAWIYPIYFRLMKMKRKGSRGVKIDVDANPIFKKAFQMVRTQ